MFFGLTNILAIFQGYINEILAQKLNVLAIVYLDDILIYIEKKEKVHVEVVWWVLD